MDSAVEINNSSTSVDVSSTDSKFSYDINEKRIIVGRKEFFAASKPFMELC